MIKILLVGAGGLIGAVGRYAVSGWVHRLMGNPWFPFGTLAVNVIGCLAIGFLAGLAESRQVFAAEVRLFLLIGLLGGFTTFSSFGYESVSLIRDGQMFAAAANVLAQVILGLGGVWLGLILSRMI